jgi:putative Ca2+/H+ antiporter (TMEM165/GDT1 family)
MPLFFVTAEGISVILVSEIGDKTFFIAAILAMQESDFKHISNTVQS